MARIEQRKCASCGERVFRRVGERRVASRWLHKRGNSRSCSF